MRLVTFRKDGRVHLGILREGRVVDVSASSERLGEGVMPVSVRELLGRGSAALKAFAALAERAAVAYARSEVEFLPPVHDARKIICVGLNYKDHAKESGVPVPSEPVIFSKFPSALVGHEGKIVLPSVSQEVDYEAELVVVIGRGGRNLSQAQAGAAVAGYTCGHDVSARDWQLKKPGGQWMLGKTFDTFAPLGPALVTADEVPDPHNLPIRLLLNGRVMQNSNTNQLIFRVEEVISYLSQVLTLEPGDLIFTGTPSGVGFARKPPVFLKAGDVTEVEIEGLGTLRNTVVQG